jgi:hypothetical protein
MSETGEMVIQLRIREANLEHIRRGQRCTFARLDEKPDGTYSLHVEARGDDLPPEPANLRRIG